MRRRTLSALALPRGDLGLVAAGALAWRLAFPPFHLLVPSFLCLVPAVWLLRRGAADPAPLRRHLVQGFWLGVASHALVLSWLPGALAAWSPLAVPASLAVLLALGFVTAVALAVAGAIGARLGVGMLIVFPMVWTAAEWAVAHSGSLRLAWLGLGTSLTGYPLLVQAGDLVGARGITFLLVAANVAAAGVLLDGPAWRRLRVLVVAAAAVATVAGYGVVRERGLQLRALGTVTALQPVAPREAKQDPERWNALVGAGAALAQRAMAAQRAMLVVWPETALPDRVAAHPAWQAILGDLADRHRVPQLVGAIVGAEAGRLYNAALLVRPGAGDLGEPVYRKRYLVPVTERVPWARAGPGSIVPGPGPADGPVSVGGARLGILICFESSFENLSRAHRRAGAEVLVNLTNDAWFGGGAGPAQHEAHLVMRAIENRVGVVRAANGGRSAVVSPLGRVVEAGPPDGAGWVTAQVATTEEITVYARLGDWVGVMAVLFVVGAGGHTWAHRT